jgi:hypothetical protein
MADLVEALGAALQRRFPRPEVKTPIAQRRGLLARMNALAGRFKGTAAQRDAQAAAAAGIGRSTWQHWRTGRHPSAASLRKLQTSYELDVVEPKWDRLIKRTMPTEVHIRAVVICESIKPGKSKRKNVKRDGPGNEEGWRRFRAEIGREGTAQVVQAWRDFDDDQAAEVLLSEIETTYGEPFDFEGDHVEVEFDG